MYWQNAEMYKVKLLSTAYTGTKFVECPAHDMHEACLFIVSVWLVILNDFEMLHRLSDRGVRIPLVFS